MNRTHSRSSEYANKAWGPSLAYTVLYGLVAYVVWWPFVILAASVAEWLTQYPSLIEWMANLGNEALRVVVAFLIWAPVAGSLAVPALGVFLVTSLLIALVFSSPRWSQRAWMSAVAGLLVGVIVSLVVAGILFETMPQLVSMFGSMFSGWIVTSAVMSYLAVTGACGVRVGRAIQAEMRQA